MRIVCLVWLALASGALAQTPAATPKKNPFEGFGNSLDKRPPGTRMARTPPPVTQIPQGTSSLSFDVRPVANGGGASASNTNASGIQTSGETRKRESQTVLEVRVRNLSTQPATAQFDWFFFARPVNQGAAYIWDRGARTISVIGGAETSDKFESTELVSSTTVTPTRTLVTRSDGSSYYQNSSVTEKSGARPVGWVVRMFADGKLVRVQGSSSEFQQLAYDPAFGTAATPRPAR